MKTLYLILLVLIALALGIGGYVLYGASMTRETRVTETPGVPLPPIVTPPTDGPLTTKDTGVQQKKSLHYEQASPAHNELFAAPPYNVTITFNFDLDPSSKITIEKDGVDYGTGDTIIDSNKLVLRRQMKQDAPDGIYTVKYSACWPDKTCHTGEHAFTVDRSQLGKYTDMAGKAAVAIDMQDIAFATPYLVVSKGTKVTWTNRESVGHYVNADPHAGHNFVLDLNSKLLNQGDSYTYTFTNAGEYPYHCSAHASEMTGRVVVK